jgi:hypothetical protein
VGKFKAKQGSSPKSAGAIYFVSLRAIVKNSPGIIRRARIVKRSSMGRKESVRLPRSAPTTIESGRVMRKKLMSAVSFPLVCLKK